MTARFEVTLINSHAACGYVGPRKSSMPEAYRGAIRKASDRFLNYKVDHRGSWDILFEAARNRQMREKSPLVIERSGNIAVYIRRG